MTARENDVTEYVNAIRDNTLHILSQKPEKGQIVSILKQRIVALGMGNTSDQLLVDIASCMIAYKLMLRKK